MNLSSIQLSLRMPLLRRDRWAPVFQAVREHPILRGLAPYLLHCSRLIRGRLSLLFYSWTPRAWRHKKKALLIGINYFRGAGDLWDSPLNTQKDVEDLKNILIELYGYVPEDVVVMFDVKDGGETYGPLEPTKENIIREMKGLVAGAKPGDHFFLHYSGHSHQITNQNHTEEDDLDEVIIPCDSRGLDCYIIDNELRKIVVDSLPAGSSLTATFDTCHSATILDLPHSRCNRIWTPWNSKGERVTDPLRNANVRRHDITSSGEFRRAFQISNQERMRNGQLISKKSSIDCTPLGSPIITESDDLKCSRIHVGPARETTLYSPIPQCDSPIKLFCDGFCTAGSVPKAYVVQISSAKDSQLSWEMNGGESMTRIMVDILRKEPYPSLRTVMKTISFRIHDISLQVHEYCRKQKMAAKERAIARGTSSEDTSWLDTDNFQDPQLSSYVPLNLDETFKV